jgi:2-oxo-4-hydroxy-4-carboxy--5-ureidoimidazoline (OHCU) decarboxylase
MYYRWRDQFLSNMGQVFETKKIDQREAYQNRQIDKMKKIINDLTIEVKKSDEDEWSS